MILYSIIAFSFITGISQPESTSKNINLKKAASEIITEARLCALITYDSAGIANVRTMQPFLPEEDFTIWFGTNSNSRKVTDIANKPDVVLYYASPDASGYVVLHGKAKIVRDDSLKQKYWMENWKDFYKEDRSDYLLIKVKPETMEILSMKHGITGDTITWKVPSFRFN